MAAARKPKLVPTQPRPRRWGILAAIAVILLIAAFVFVRPYWRMASHFEDVTFRQPSRLYARATRLFEGRNYPPDLLVAGLADEGYREDKTSRSLPAGRYRRTKQGVDVHLRTFPLPDGSHGGGLAEITYQGTRIAALRQNGKAADSVILDPPLLASYHGPNLLERRPVDLKEVSPDLINSILAAEDETFFHHAGISPTGIARALWVDLSGRGRRQGGSTLTQQLVKNLYLTQEKTLTRKSQEVLLAVLLDLRYPKTKILEAYLNEIYLGGSGGVSLLGVGAASRAYFGKDPGQLDLAEAATIAGMIPSPANYSPAIHPDRAKERRDWVLGRLAKLGLVPQERVDQALREPIAVAPEPVVRRRAPYFADSAALEASRRFGVEDLEDGGYVLFSTLDWSGQKAAEEAVETGLKQIDGGRKGRALQAALVSMDPATGGILAYIGGRGYDKSQFDRAGQAQRQPGSSFKPIVYAAAFEAGKASPASFLDDEPLSLRTGAGIWTPKNDDGTSHGWVSARTALEKSYNLATARLATEVVGMPKIIKLASDMGITTPMQPFPAMALGAAAVTPLEMATVYSTLAGGGSRPPVHELVAVLDRYGKPVQGAPLPKPVRVLSAQTTYLVTSLLEGVLQRGTAAGAAQGIPGELAGKTGTTNQQRDAWFAGYAPERATVVWVGYDDNARTRLSGARAALPIWVRFMARVAPPGGYSAFATPQGITTASIDPTTGMLATEGCPYVITEVFREGEVPTQVCDRHGGGLPEPQVAAAGEPVPEERAEEPAARAEERRAEPRTLRSFFRRLFGRRDRGEDRGKEQQERAPGNEDGGGNARKPPAL
ncbi:MAG TPA: PBP1A family penicillin-binding protein [Thermoanaerobaculia bacterium]|nr:PBP1A family penicillin-binding protein [Thermoanaerobaculia bacterium]